MDVYPTVTTYMRYDTEIVLSPHVVGNGDLDQLRTSLTMLSGDCAPSPALVPVSPLMSPAQAKRKAQNRAAYAESIIALVVLLNFLTVSVHSENVEQRTSEI